MKKYLRYDKINHLKWCLEQLKFLEYKNDEDIYRDLYKDIIELISKLEVFNDKDDIKACEFYREEVYHKKIKERLLIFGLELIV